MRIDPYLNKRVDGRFTRKITVGTLTQRSCGFAGIGRVGQYVVLKGGGTAVHRRLFVLDAR